MESEPYPFTSCLVDLLIVACWGAIGFLCLWEITHYVA